MRRRIVLIVISTALSVSLVGCNANRNIPSKDRFRYYGNIAVDTKTGVEYYCGSRGITTPLYNADGTLCINEKYKPKDTENKR